MGERAENQLDQTRAGAAGFCWNGTLFYFVCKSSQAVGQGVSMATGVTVLWWWGAGGSRQAVGGGGCSGGKQRGMGFLICGPV